MNLIEAFNALYAISSEADKKMWHEQNDFGDEKKSIQLSMILAMNDRLEKALEFYANIENWECKSYDRNSDYYSKCIEDSGDIAREALT